MSLKDIFRKHIKSTKTITTMLGEIDFNKEIGEGGNGIVYSCRLHDKDVAVKVLVTDNKDKKTRFKAEYFNIVILPEKIGIVELINYEELDIEKTTFPIIIMKKYKESLSKSKAKRNKKNLLKLLYFLLDTVKNIHEHEIIHRDIKPENILIDENDNLVLTDFGIANFSSELYALKGKTKNGDRMANFDFSAPEQTHKGIVPDYTMDIYSIAQVCQWFMTGSVHKGTNRTSINSSSKEDLKTIDSIIGECLSNNSDFRYQSIEEIQEAIINNSKTRTKEPLDYLLSFFDALSNGFPKGINKVCKTTDTKIIDRILDKLNEKKFGKKLWWNKGMPNLDTIFKKFGNLWVMEPLEIEIDKIISYRSNDFYTDLLIIITNPSKHFGLYDTNYHYEEAALVDDTYYITRSEYDSGIAEINEEIVNLSEHKVEIRTREMKKQVYVIGTEYHNCIIPSNDKSVKRLVKLIEGNNYDVDDDVILEFIQEIRLNRHHIIERNL